MEKLINIKTLRNTAIPAIEETMNRIKRAHSYLEAYHELYSLVNLLAQMDIITSEEYIEYLNKADRILDERTNN